MCFLAIWEAVLVAYEKMAQNKKNITIQFV